MARPIEKQVIETAATRVVEDTFRQLCHVDFSAEPVVEEKDIIEYNGNMRLFPMDKFNGQAYIGVINYYLTQKDFDEKYPVGTFVLYVKEDIAEKLVKALGRSAREAEDELIVLGVVGEFTGILGGNVKNELKALGYAELILSVPLAYKNVVPEGALFDYNLFRKQEISFSFWKQKCVVVEACIGPVPRIAL